MQDNPFAQYAPQQPATPQGGPIYSPAPVEKPISPIEMERLRISQQGESRAQQAENRNQESSSISNELARLKIEEQKNKIADDAKIEQAQSQGITDDITQMKRVIAAAKKAQNLSNSFFATGFGADTAKGFGGSTANDVDALLNIIGSSTAFDRLQKMRNESKTGGALGAVSEIELKLLRDSIASLDQSQSDEQFQNSMQQIIDAYQTVIDRLEPQQAAQQGAAGQQPQGGARQPTNQDIYQNGVEFNDQKWMRDDVFDRSQYLAEQGWGGGKEALMNGFMRANTGNPDITAADVQAFYEANGIPIPPDPSNFEFTAQSLRDGVENIGIDTSSERDAYVNQLDEGLDARGIRPENYGDTIGAKISQGLALGFGDELQGAVGAAGALLTGGNPVAAYGAERDMVRRQLERSESANPKTSIASELVGGVASGVGLMKAPTSIASAARQGAAFGGVGGFGYGDGLGGSTVNALGGAALGGALGAAGQKAGNALANRAANQTASGNVTGAQVQQAADALNMQPIPAMTGGTATRRLTGAARQGFVSDMPIAKAVENLNTRGGEVRGDIASGVGKVLDGTDGGEIVRQGAKIYSQRTSATGGKLFDRADRFANGSKHKLPSAIQVAKEEMAQIAKAPGGKDSTLYKDLGKLQQQMSEGAFEVDGIRKFRTTLRNEITASGLRGSPQDAVYAKILRAAHDDMIAGLRAAGNDKAVGALNTARDFWRKRVETIDEVLDPLLGKNTQRSGEQIMSTLERMANPKTGNSQNLRRLMQALPKDEAASVQATVINRMGAPTAGKAELIEEGGFSFDTFLTNWNNMSPRAKATLFPSESRAALNQLATIAKGYKQAGAAMNTSNTGGAILNQGAVSGALWLIDPIASGAGLLSQYGMGKLLASPRFAKWLAGAPRTADPKVKSQYLGKLGSIAKAEPALAGEIEVLRNAIIGAANDNAGRMSAVANEPEQ